VENESSKNLESVFSKKLRAGRRRTYFFDVKTTRSGDYFLTITESKKRFNEDGYDRHKIFLYKEDFNKFLEAMTETVNHVKTELMPNYNFDEFSHREGEEGHEHETTSDQENGNNQENGNTESSVANDVPAEESNNSADATPVNDEDLKW